ncbi:hypothetical protein A8F94_02780 [Bacillus sp. FJAT-27225]|uniref:hypothetical protein n=1 Tax=Bacillus sp. FJAT-27225 TaxID=1743144 RepID=UPI00080C2B16|nr:hypothetical protein [Bacillus sp. FJAT-27225]OCA90817.1 hypothetical protein A8F94_02780 [Bacillus sp. FJAT-27225]
MDYDRLLEEYRKVWNNRRLESIDNQSEMVLKDAIRRELLDENSHPRARKGLLEKYYSATKRLLASSLNDRDKVSLLQLHVDIVLNLEKR